MLLSLAVIFLCGMGMGAIFRRLNLPQLLGMLLTGILLGPYALNLLDGSILSISADLRQIALIIILTRAGLNLDVADLKKVGRAAVLMCWRTMPGHRCCRRRKAAGPRRRPPGPTENCGG